MKAQTMLKKAPVDWEKAVDRMKPDQRDELSTELERLSLRAGELAAYIEERHGYGCGDQGHKKAVKACNRVGKLIWCKGFGYNGHFSLTI